MFLVSTHSSSDTTTCSKLMYSIYQHEQRICWKSSSLPLTINIIIIPSTSSSLALSILVICPDEWWFNKVDGERGIDYNYIPGGPLCIISNPWGIPFMTGLAYLMAMRFKDIYLVQRSSADIYQIDRLGLLHFEQ